MSHLQHVATTLLDHGIHDAHPDLVAYAAKLSHRLEYVLLAGWPTPPEGSPRSRHVHAVLARLHAVNGARVQNAYVYNDDRFIDSQPIVTA